MIRIVPIVLLLLLQGVAYASDSGSVSKDITITINENIILFLKAVFWIAGIFIAFFSFVCVAFFGFDVRMASISINDARKEVEAIRKELYNEIDMIRKDKDLLKIEKDNIEQRGAQLDETKDNLNLQGFVPPQGSRSNLDLIREIIKDSNYTWTTI